MKGIICIEKLASSSYDAKDRMLMAGKDSRPRVKDSRHT